MTEEQIRAWALLAAATGFNTSLNEGFVSPDQFYQTVREYATFIRSGQAP